MATTQYDAVIIGSGQAGNPLAMGLAKAGWKTALIEREHVGGTCINVGCTPTKTMVASARVAYLARRAADYGVHHGAITVDMGEVRQRKRDMVRDFRESSQTRLEKTANLDLLFGEARFIGAKTLEVSLHTEGTHQLAGDKIFLNTGARPSMPAIAGIGDVPFLDSTTVMELDVVPGHLLVIGGGYIGLEFAQMFRRFGSEVTIVHRGEQLLAREDKDVAEAVANILREDGIHVSLRTDTQRAACDADGTIRLTVHSSGGDTTLSGSHVLVAVGRTPNTDKLNLPAAGLQPDERGYVPVNERLETSAPDIYALGDVNGGPAFTHIAYDDFRIVRANLLEGGNATTQQRLAPYTVFIDPQLGRVGVSETEARRQGRNIKVAKLEMSHVARALEMDETRGFIKAVVDAESNQILGCAVFGIEGGEIMSAIQIAMMGKVTCTALRDAVFAHPTLMESLNNLFTS